MMEWLGQQHNQLPLGLDTQCRLSHHQHGLAVVVVMVAASTLQQHQGGT
jgi:hypothetical protein